ncbi:hypothetical protein FRX31_019049 [Thalictrum thalictroides]|uniref:Uncharacterized protein n=1 Tax=Thalictrum thalictroides TaxID=46969 RepID=A0A7J6W4W5_THATH|nr:hypothetical protein FRX31_019049 [Thalictrum thalictroides]
MAERRKNVFSIVWKTFELELEGRDKICEIGFLGRELFKDLTILVYARENKDGRFLLMLFVSKQLQKGKVTFCVPASDNFSGWVAFKANLQAFCGVGRKETTNPLDPPSMYAEKVGGAHGLVKIDEHGGEYKEISRVRILVEKCDLLKVPHILPLMEDGVRYPIRIYPEFENQNLNPGVEKKAKLNRFLYGRVKDSLADVANDRTNERG